MLAPLGWRLDCEISYRKPRQSKSPENDEYLRQNGHYGLCGKAVLVSEPNAQDRKLPFRCRMRPKRKRERNESRVMRIAFLASTAEVAQRALTVLTARYDNCAPEEAEVIVALGGDGFMLHTLHDTIDLSAPVYGMNRGTVGFLMNEYQEDGLIARLEAAEQEIINPLSMTAMDRSGRMHRALAINEVSLLRAGPQAARLKISVDGRQRMAELVCDGALVSTPAGSTAYNYSAHGPILPIGSDVLALTAVAAFRPRRWRGALLPSNAKVRFDVLEADKRPVMAEADSVSFQDIDWVEIQTEASIRHKILFDPGHGLEERLISEQFT
ncbi:NAD kinase [Phycobacter azelaicus]|uniref:NAD kinase n=1 Tax=Phycobacter azelaicus TaxID=2668075 RepID=UPI001D02F444|nr:NAD kinase [Phycobacter azelaicus]